MAMVFGVTSAKMTISAVMIAVAYTAPWSPATARSTLVAKDDAAMLTTWPPSSIALIKRPRSAISRLTSLAA